VGRDVGVMIPFSPEINYQEQKSHQKERNTKIFYAGRVLDGESVPGVHCTGFMQVQRWGDKAFCIDSTRRLAPVVVTQYIT
jgi:hypothetical protein